MSHHNPMPQSPKDQQIKQGSQNAVKNPQQNPSQAAAQNPLNPQRPQDKADKDLREKQLREEDRAQKHN